MINDSLTYVARSSVVRRVEDQHLRPSNKDGCSQANAQKREDLDEHSLNLDAIDKVKHFLSLQSGN